MTHTLSQIAGLNRNRDHSSREVRAVGSVCVCQDHRHRAGRGLAQVYSCTMRAGSRLLTATSVALQQGSSL